MALESALHVLRGIPTADGECPPGSPGALRENLARERDALINWAAGSGLILDGKSYLDRVTGGGAEHEVFIEPKEHRVFKITRRFGLTIGTSFRMGKRTQKYLGVPFVRDATPLEYLERLALVNDVFADDIRLEGIIKGEREAIVTSQPVVRGRSATPEEIIHWMAQLGFSVLQNVIAGRRDSASFFRASDGVAAFDAHGENVLTDGEQVAPIDLLTVTASEDLAAFLSMSADARYEDVGVWRSLS